MADVQLLQTRLPLQRCKPHHSLLQLLNQLFGERLSIHLLCRAQAAECSSHIAGQGRQWLPAAGAAAAAACQSHSTHCTQQSTQGWSVSDERLHANWQRHHEQLVP